MNPIHGHNLGQVCVDAAEGDELEVEAGGPDIMTQREAVELAFEIVGKPEKVTVMNLGIGALAASMVWKTSLF